MALNARHARFERVVVRMPIFQRPGRRTFSLAFGLVSMLVLIDAIFHPGSPAGLWSARTIQDLSALMLELFATVAELFIGSAAVVATWGAAPVHVLTVPWWVSIVALGLAAAAYGCRGRLTRSRASDAAETTEHAGRATAKIVPYRVIGGEGDPLAPVSFKRRPTQRRHPSDIPCRAA